MPGRRGVDAAEAIERLADVGITTFEVTAIERDGLLEGPDLAPSTSDCSPSIEGRSSRPAGVAP